MVGLEMHRVLVTGGSGFIGNHVVRNLVLNGVSVCNVDLKAPEADLVQQWTHGDILDSCAMRSLVKAFSPDALVHLAGETDILDVKDLTSGFPVNTLGVDSLSRAFSEMPLTRAIFASTQYVCSPNQPASQTLEQVSPYTSYGRSKAVMEACIRASRFNWTIVRPTYVWGPGAGWRFQQLVSTIESRRYLHPLGSPVLRSYGYVKNVARQICCIASNNISSQMTVYIGDRTIDSAQFVDSLSIALTAKRARRAPRSVLAALALIGEINTRFPLNWFRYQNMTSAWEVDVEPITSLCGVDTYGLKEAVEDFVGWKTINKRLPDEW